MGMLINWETSNLDVLFDSDNEHGVPNLKLNQQAGGLILPCEIYGTMARARVVQGTYLFYVQDDVLNPLWRYPRKIFDAQCEVLGEVNFSCTKDMPEAVAVYQIYRKRWLSRFWAENGIRILVDLNVAERWDALNLLGVPFGWRAFVTQGYVDFIERLNIQLEIAKKKSGRNDPIFVVYAGGKKIQEWCRKNSGVYVERFINSGRYELKAKENGPEQAIGTRRFQLPLKCFGRGSQGKYKLIEKRR